MENIRDAFFKNFNRLIDESSLSNKAIAKKLGVSEPTFYRWKNGDNPPDSTTIEALAKILDVDPFEFYRPTESKQRPFAETLPVGRLIQLLDSKAGSIPDEIFDLSKGIAKDNKVWESVIVLLERAHKELEKQKGKSESI